MNSSARGRRSRTNPSTRSRASRAEELISWFAAAVLVTGGVLYALNTYEKSRSKPRPTRIVPNATPAQEPLILQDKRASEPGRGRSARTPLQIPWRGWKDIVGRAYQEIFADRLLALASSVVFYSLVALFPGIAAG